MAQTPAVESEKKTRRSAPKSKGGCRPCKLRHSKCDEAKPTCSRCWRAGLACEYPVKKSKPARTRTLVPLRPATTTSNSLLDAETSHSGFLTPVLQAIDEYMSSTPSSVSSPGPLKSHLTDFPGTTTEHRSFEYFLSRTASDLGLFSDDVLWSLVVTRIAYNERTVRHALVAVAALHEDRLREIGGQVPINKIFSITQYSKAIQALNERLSDDKLSYQITLLNCLLFGYFEFLRGSPETGLMHLYSGMKLLPSYNKRYTKTTPGGARSTTEEPLVDLELARTFSRLRVPALVRTPITQQTWNPIREYDVGVHRGLPFSSLPEAEDRLRPLVLHAFDPYGVAQNSSTEGAAKDAEDALRDDVGLQLQDWTMQLGLFLVDNAHTQSPGELKVVCMLRLQSLVARLWNAIGRSSQQVDYDKFIPEFRSILLLVGRMLPDQRQSFDMSTPTSLVEDVLETIPGRSRASFTPPQSPDMRIISPKLLDRQRLEVSIALYFTAAKCRSPTMRRQALRILHGRSRSDEPLPYSGIFARIVRRVIDFEEQQCSQPITEDVSTWPTEEMRIKRTFFLPIYDVQRKSQTAMFLWQPDGPGTETRNWMERFSF